MKISQSSFASGEIAPSWYGDPEVGATGCREVLNMLVTRSRSLLRRGGFRYIAPVKDQGLSTLLIPFRIPAIGSYVVEAGNAYFRFYGYLSDVPVRLDIAGEIATPYLTSELADIDSNVSKDVLNLTHGSHHPRELTRVSDTSWVLTPNAVGSGDIWDGIGPVYEVRKRDISLSIGGTIVALGSGTLLADKPFFNTTDTPLNSMIGIHSGWVRIHSIRSPYEAVVFHLATKPISDAPTAEWTGPYLAQTPSAENITHDTAATGAQPPPQVQFTASAAIFTDADIGKLIDIDSTGSFRVIIVRITGLVGAAPTAVATGELLRGTMVTAPPTTGNDNTKYVSTETGDVVSLTPSVRTGTGTLIASGNYFTAGHAPSATEPGARFSLNGGLVRVTAYTSPTQVNITVESDLDSTGTSRTWEEEVNRDGGYPRAVTNHQGRRMYGGCDRNGDQFWGSKSTEMDIYETGAFDADPINFEMQDNAGNIQWMLSAKDLILGLEDGEYTIGGSPLSSSQFGADRQSAYGSARIRAELLGNETIYADLSGTKLLAALFSFDSDRYNSEELSERGAHLFETSTIKQIAITRRPETIIFVLLADGTLLAFSYKRERIAGWSKIVMGGTDSAVDSICVIRNGPRDDLWCIVSRTLNSGPARYVEVYDPDSFLDSFLTETELTLAAGSISGLSHLEGETVKIRLDGVYRGEFEVSAGTVDISSLNLSAAPTTAEVGLGYTYRVKLSPVLSQDNAGPTFARDQTIHGIRVRVKDTLGLGIGAEDIDVFRETDVGSGTPATPYSGFVDADGPEPMGDKDDPVITLQGSDPLPCEILGVTLNVEVGA